MKMSFPFSDEVMTYLIMLVQRAQKQARTAKLKLVFAKLTGLLLIPIGLLEYELLYRLFDYLADGEAYWSPHLMALTGFIMIIGYHLLAEKYQDNIAIRFINKTTGVVLVAYAIGITFLVANMMISDGIGGMASTGMPDFNNIGSSITEQISLLLEQLLNIVGSNAFALGAGGLAILNLFVGHSLISNITQSLKIHLPTIKNAQTIKANFKIVRDELECHQALEADFDSLVYEDSEEEITKLAVMDCLEAIDEGLAPHQSTVNTHQYQLSAAHPFSTTKEGEANVGELREFIKTCREFNFERINTLLSTGAQQ